MLKHERSLSTGGKAELSVTPKKLRSQKGCTCLDKLVNEERERHAKNIAFQKALIKRLEASERRISYDDWDEDDDDDDDSGDRGSRGRGRSRRSGGSQSPPKIKLPKYRRKDNAQDCLCYKKIRKEERKRKNFVKRLERQQEKYELKSLKAQRKYEKRRIKAYKKCERLENAIDAQYAKGHRNVKITQGDDTYRVFLHMDPGECGCNQRERCLDHLKKAFFKCCVCLYLLGFLIAYVLFYIFTKF